MDSVSTRPGETMLTRMPCGPEFRRQAARQGLHRGFRDQEIAPVHRGCVQGKGRANVDDAPGFLLDHSRDRRLGAVKRAAHVHVQGRLHLLPGGLHERTRLGQAAGVIDEYAHRAVCIRRAPSQRPLSRMLDW